MNIVNYSITIIGGFVVLIGLLAFLNPNWAKWINFPGGSRLKAAGATIVGLILILIGLLVEFFME